MDKTAGIIALISTVRDKANRIILRKLKERGIHDIAPAHGSILVALFRNDELPMGQIAKMIDRDKSTVTTLVNKLVKNGYLERRKDDSDSRVTLIRLTNKGKALEYDFFDISRELITMVYSGFSESEKENLMRFMGRVKNNL
jgi:DNA-binding MarR family transcriptional regulator